MIVVDTSVLVALVDERDGLHARAKKDLKRLKRNILSTTWAVLTETFFLLERPFERRRVRFLLDSLRISATPSVERGLVLDWMEKYESHQPDFADAELVVLTDEHGSKIWTYDREFQTTWRRLDGSKVPLATKDR